MDNSRFIELIEAQITTLALVLDFARADGQSAAIKHGLVDLLQRLQAVLAEARG